MTVGYPDALRSDALFASGPRLSMDAEAAVIGILLQWPDALHALPSCIMPETFTHQVYSRAFSIILDHVEHGVPVTDLSVVAQYNRDHDYEPGAISSILDTVHHAPAAACLPAYAGIVRDAHLASLVAAEARQAERDVRNGVDPVQRAQAASQRLTEISQVETDEVDDLDDQMEDYLDRLEQEAQGNVEPATPTRIQSLDRMLDGGMRPNDLGVIAGRPGMGKTSLALSILSNAAYAGYGVGGFWLEMSKKQMNGRWLQLATGIEGRKFRCPWTLTQGDKRRIGKAKTKLRDLVVKSNYSAGLTIDQIVVKAHRWRRQCEHEGRPLAVIAVDYLQIMGGISAKYQVADYERVTSRFKQLAKDLECCILLLAQLNRDVEKRAEPHIPQQSDLRSCGSIEQDADWILFPHRPQYYELKKGGIPSVHEDDANIYIGKQRDGGEGKVPVRYTPAICRYGDRP